MSSTLDVVSLADGTTSRIAVLDHLEKTRYHTTYRGTWFQDGKETQVMIKALQAERITSSEMARFIQEGDVLKTHSSEGIVNILDLVRLDGKPTLLLDWVDGITLQEAMGGRPCPLDQFLEIAIQLAQTMGGLHKNNIIHKEITPRHVLITQGLAKLTDFSLISTLTKKNEAWFDTAVIRNYLSYVSPEQTGRMNRPVDYRTDFYSLGVTFYEMLTNKLPFAAKDPIKLIHSHLAILPEPPSTVRPDIPETISDIVMMLLEKNAESRYQSGFGLVADLLTCQEMLGREGTVLPFDIGRKDIPIKYSIPQVIIGRNDKLTNMIQAFEDMERSGETIVMVSGEPGVGKSALINEIQKPIVARRGYFLSGKYDQFKKDVPYSAIVQAFGQLIRQLLAECQDRQAQWRKRLMAALGVSGKIITDVIPDMELLIGPQPDIPDVGPEEAKNRFNNIFSTFVSLFTQREHPVVLFLDDLQWADSASLKLIRQLVIDPNIRFLFLIGAYRHTEVHPAHPMMGMLDEIEKEAIPIKHIALEPLGIASVNLLLANFLKADERDTRPLSLLVHKKTGGNPFFINQFVKTLYEEHYLKLDPVEGWQWDMDALEQMQVTDNVVSLMTQKIEKFKKSTQDILKICACIGNRFDLETMATIYRKPIGETLADINDAIEEGLVYLDEDEYKFLHDRIQEAAYSLLSEKEREDIHYRIGRYFFDITSEDKLIEKILYIVGHLNAGIGMVESGEEKERIIQYNLIAAGKSKNSNAYNEGLLYLRVAIGLLAADCWENQYALAVDVYTSAAEAAFLSGEYELMDAYADQVLAHVRTILEKARVQRIRILAMIARAKTRDALILGLKVLKSLGVKLPETPGKLDLIKGLLRVMLALRGKDTDTLLNLPEMTDPHKIMAMDIITCIASAVYMINPQLYPLLGFERILLSIKYGNNADSQIGYVSYGLIMSGVLGKTELGDGFGQLALALSKKYSSSRSRVYCVYYAFVGPWKHGLKDKLAAYIQGYNMGIESGEFEFAAYNLQMYCMVNYFIGAPLPKVAELTTLHFQAINRLKQDIPSHLHTMLRQKVSLLTGEDPFTGEFDGSAFDKETMLPELITAQERVSLLYYYTGGGIVAYAFGLYEKSVDFFIDSDTHMDSAKGFFLRMPVVFYDAMACLGAASLKTKHSRRALLRRAARHIKSLKLWAKNCPANNLAKYHLATAEWFRVKNNSDKAIEHYGLAISSAKKIEFIHEEALAYELCFKFWKEKGHDDLAMAYFKSAIQCYQAWGASAIVNHLKTTYPEAATALTSLSMIAGGADDDEQLQVNFRDKALFAENLDMASIIKTSQAISREMDLGKLIEKLVKISIENAGAEKGFLIIENEDDHKLYIQGSGVAGSKIEVLQSEGVENSTDLCVSIVNYVHKTRKNIVINDAQNDDNFKNDPYIVTHKSKSIICSPIKRKGKISGIVYLENNLSTNAFTSERLKVLQLFSSQAAISIENSILLAQREKTIRLETEMMLAAELQTSLVPGEPALPGFDISGYMKPADEVGGDYYDVIPCPHDEGRDWVIIGDVSGHGIQAGLIMLMVQTSMQLLISNDYSISPSVLISTIDKVITSNIAKMRDSKYMTISALSIHRQSGVIKHAGLHQDMCVYRKGEQRVEQIESSGIWIGIGMHEIGLREDQKLVLAPGDVLLLFTDGVTEAVNAEGKFFCQDNLVRVLESNSAGSSREIQTAILYALTPYTATDDVSFLVLKKV